MKQEYINKILDLAKNLSPDDRSKAMEELEISEPTLRKYLSGDITKFDVADKLIAFMEKAQSLTV